MPMARCKGCGRETNSTTSDYWFTEDRIPTRCYVAWEGHKPVKGCGYEQASPFEKDFADEILNRYTKRRGEVEKIRGL